MDVVLGDRCFNCSEVKAPISYSKGTLRQSDNDTKKVMTSKNVEPTGEQIIKARGRKCADTWLTGGALVAGTL